MLRKRLHKMGIHKAVFSAEKKIREGAMIIDEQTNKKSNTGTISTCRPFSAAAADASVVIRDLIGGLR